ncbi:MAG: DUF1844 domain-containing protein [Phycisphaerales bacterium]|nr:DUF1844 domain-containing protein [Phycisphaerales bacterium]
MSDETPRLHIDNDWKAQAQAEKDRFAEKAEARVAAASPAAGVKGQEGPPPTGFQMLVASLASQAVMGLGGMQDPETGKVMIDLEGAQFAMGMLGVLHEKTKGNLSAEEASELEEVLNHLQQRFMQIAQLVASQMQRESAAGVGGLGSPILGSIGSSKPAPSRAGGGPRIELP